MQRILHHPIVGSSQPQQWAQVLLNRSQHVVCCLSLTGEKAAELGRLFVSEFIDFEPSSAIQLHTHVERLIETAQQQHCQVQLAAGAFFDESCLLIAFHGNVLLRRAGRVGNILTATDEVKVLEGKNRAGDLFVLSTEQVQAVMSEVQHQLELQADAETFAAQLVPHVLNHPDNALMALTSVEFSSHAHSPAQSHASITTPTDASSVSTSAPHVHESHQDVGSSPAQSLRQLPYLFNLTVERFKKIGAQVGQYRQELFSKDVYVRKRQTKNIVRVVLPILILVIVGGVFFFVQRSQRLDQLRQAQTILAPVEGRLSEIKVLSDQDPVKAREETGILIAQLETSLEQHKNQSILVAELQKELGELRQFADSISGKEELQLLPTFFDLRLVQSDFIASSFDLSGGTMVFADAGRKKLLALDIEKKQTTLLPTESLAELKDIVFQDRQIYLLGAGIFRLTFGSSDTPTELKAADDDNRTAQLIRNFGTNLYLLNRERRNIFRYTTGEDGKLSESAAWLKPDHGLDFSTLQSMAIDGDIWLTTKDGQIKKFTSGNESSFGLTGLKENFTSPLMIFTKEGLENLYVLEPQKERLVILNKQGEFLKEVKSRPMASATAVVADETSNKAYVLSGSLVFEVGF